MNPITKPTIGKLKMMQIMDNPTIAPLRLLDYVMNFDSFNESCFENDL